VADSSTGGVDVPNDTFAAPGTTPVRATVRTVTPFSVRAALASRPAVRMRVHLETGPDKGTGATLDVDPTVVKSGIETVTLCDWPVLRRPASRRVMPSPTSRSTR
jgi:hypothetical protein